MHGLSPRALPLRALLAPLALLAALAIPGAGPPSDDVVVLVTARDGRVGEAVQVVEGLGGTVAMSLPVVGGFAAEVPVAALSQLEVSPAVAALRQDQHVQVQASGADPGGGPSSAYRDVIGATTLSAAGRSGAGVTVALVDTGVAPVDDLRGRIVPVTDDVTGTVSDCVDFSGEGHCGDSYGHGTFMAGIIAGNGAASGGTHVGVAPGARILSLKVAGADGSSDVSKVVAAIQWVVSYRERYGIEVLNLSLGTDSVQSWEVDPFNYAVERAWEAGITVVVSASNRGPSARTVSKPGDDPYVITVGAIDDRGTRPAGDDRLPDFSSRGPTAAGVAKPDVVAPGVRLVSLRAPDSTIDRNFAESVDGAYHRGSGTSMSTAAVTGGVALLIEQHQDWTPGQVKQALRSTAVRTASTDPSAVGSGLVDLVAASRTAPASFPTPWRHSSGLGSLDASRGNVRVEGATVQEAGSTTLLSAGILLWDPVGLLTGEWSARTWPVSPWAGHQWHTTTWAGDNWHGDNWHGDNWHGDWTGSAAGGSAYDDDTYGRPWLGGAWYGLWE